MLVAFRCFNLLLSVLSEFSIFQISLRQLNYYICSLVSVSFDSMFLWESFCSFFNNLKLPLIVDLYNFAAQLWEIQLHKWYVIQILLITTEMSWAVLLMSFYQLNILLQKRKEGLRIFHFLHAALPPPPSYVSLSSCPLL